MVAAPGAKKVTLIGNELDNFLSGRSGKDRLEGRGGNDSLDGDRGADTMLGGPGDDSYWVGHKKDLVVEQPGEGVDIVQATAAFTLPANVENLKLEARAAQGIGNDEDNRIEGAGLTTLLDGRGGDDTIRVWISGDNVAVTVRGGTGADRIRWEGRPPDTRSDTVADFAPAEGDVLDLDALLPAGASTDPLAFLRLAPAAGGASLELDVDGAAGPAGWAPLALLPGIAAGEASLRTLLTSGAIELG
ncbi:MAG: type I secretion C-terminal target domain-containing protein [Geminicoccaceae bacterium]|nr:type I secretion C-terminal target domain-containing protein [Geminicoccaceae bacterium]